MKIFAIFGFLLLQFCDSVSFAREIAITVDDPYILNPAPRNQDILDVFSVNKIKAALFVCGKQVDMRKF